MALRVGYQGLDRPADEGAVPARTQRLTRKVHVMSVLPELTPALAWVVLIAAGCLELVWAAALSSFSSSTGFRRVRPLILFALGLCGSMLGLAWAMLYLPPGTSYAVWVGTGGVLTVIWGFATRQERLTWVRVGLLTVLVASIVGLKVVA
jgi:quaternary ammonium compound-resistance protein SugE